MNPSTMDRMLKGVKREKPGSMLRNRRSGRKDELLKAIECKSGELVMGCNVQTDNVREYVSSAVAEWRGERWKIPFSR